jgi:hypothetical protein
MYQVDGPFTQPSQFNLYTSQSSLSRGDDVHKTTRFSQQCLEFRRSDDEVCFNCGCILQDVTGRLDDGECYGRPDLAAPPAHKSLDRFSLSQRVPQGFLGRVKFSLFILKNIAPHHAISDQFPPDAFTFLIPYASAALASWEPSHVTITLMQTSWMCLAPQTTAFRRIKMFISLPIGLRTLRFLALSN